MKNVMVSGIKKKDAAVTINYPGLVTQSDLPSLESLD
jgi:hypothetical protein